MVLGLNVDNCPKCGEIYDRNLRNMCPSCSKQLDDMLDLCERFMRRNEKATTGQLQQGTGVAIGVIEKFIKEKRLRSSYYTGLTYPCEKCGRGIREARICKPCGMSLLEAFQPQRPAEPPRAAGSGFRTGDRYGR